MSAIPEQDRDKLPPPPHLVSIQFGSVWNVATPTVYRYEDERWIDEFFQTGKLRISTFSKFATYPDEVRGDTREGKAYCYGETSNDTSMGVFQAEGFNSVVLCCSHRLDHKLREGFERDAAFKIINTVGFALEIARQLPGFRHGLEGSCIYRADAIIKRAVDFDRKKHKLADGNVDMQMVFAAGATLGGPELRLLKEKRHEDQQEYRLAWDLDALEADHVDVFAPLAREFCRRVEPDEWGD